MGFLRTVRLLLALGAALVIFSHPQPADPGSRAVVSQQIWVPPLGPPLRVESPFSLPNGPYQAGHRGIDVAAVAGAEVRSPAAGTVTFVGTVVDRPVISIRVDAHTVLSMEPVESELLPGMKVSRGGVVGMVGPGAVGEGSHCGLTCVHLGVRINGQYVNPLRFLQHRPILLPW